MLTSQALKVFDNDRGALAAALGIRPESTYSWGRRVPPLRQLQLERVTGGVLEAEKRLKPPVLPRFAETATSIAS